ncbi:MAG: hypothetical protein HQ547_04360 [Candidatus Omnitrophica bacterium]|nr:hypothetical protein [Candidatus Omnitrophota bacterium]
MRNLFRITIIALSILAVISSTAHLRDSNAEDVIRAAEVKFSPTYGRITEVFDGGQDKLVVHIQDAHTNYGAQKNSAHILEELINNYGLYLILVEGGSRDVSLNHYRNSPLEQREKEAEEALKEGIIAGEEYLNIASDYPMKLQGVEDRALYDRNMEAYLGVDEGKEEVFAYTKLLSSVVAGLKIKLYSKDLKVLDAKMSGFKHGKVGLNDYVSYLSKAAGTKKIDLSNYQNYKSLLDSIELEKVIDFAAVDKERAEAIDGLSKKVGQDELNELLSKSVDFKSGKVTQTQYHVYLKDLLVKAKLDINQYPNLEKYVAYMISYDRIDSAGLFKELKLIEDDIAQAFIANDDQKRLVRIAKDLELLTEFMHLKLAPHDFEYYQKNEEKFNIPVWVRFLKSQAAKYNIKENIPEDASAIEKMKPYLKDFYVIARKRDDIFLNNTKKYMEENDVNIAVLIAGGFHTPTLMQLFKKENISYVVVSPKVLGPTDEKAYHKVLTEGWAPAGQTGLR